MTWKAPSADEQPTPRTDALWARESFRAEAINADRCGGGLVSMLRDHARTLERELALARSALAGVEAGTHVVVPKEPTHEMVLAGQKAYAAGCLDTGIYRAALRKARKEKRT
jgi:hypothetical protein